jgi:hypothetical protein
MAQKAEVLRSSGPLGGPHADEHRARASKTTSGKDPPGVCAQPHGAHVRSAPEAGLRSIEILEQLTPAFLPWKGEALRALALKRQERVGVSLGMRR